MFCEILYPVFRPDVVDGYDAARVTPEIATLHTVDGWEFVTVDMLSKASLTWTE